LAGCTSFATREAAGRFQDCQMAYFQTKNHNLGKF
jgi:hypothetical protein